MILQARQATRTLQSYREEYVHHPSILKIKRKKNNKGLGFSFKYVTRNKIAKEMQNLDSKKASQDSDIPVKAMKKLRYYFSFYLQ